MRLRLRSGECSQTFSPSRTLIRIQWVQEQRHSDRRIAKRRSEEEMHDTARAHHEVRRGHIRSFDEPQRCAVVRRLSKTPKNSKDVIRAVLPIAVS